MQNAYVCPESCNYLTTVLSKRDSGIHGFTVSNISNFQLHLEPVGVINESLVY